VVEGPQGVREAVNYAPELVQEVYATAVALARYTEIADAITAANIKLTQLAPEVSKQISVNAQELIAVVKREPNQLGDWLTSGSKPKLIAILSNARDPGNVGTIIRVADAFGADAVVLAGDTVELTNPKVVRSTAGSLFHVPVFSAADLKEVVAQCQAAGLQVLAADGSADITLPQIKESTLKNPTAWLFGNEAWGLAESDRQLADAVVKVPIVGNAESLNLATAATVCLWDTMQSQASAAAPV